jgi:hypothetical protein
MVQVDRAFAAVLRKVAHGATQHAQHSRRHARLVGDESVKSDFE